MFAGTSDSDDEVASGGGGRYEKLARAKREDMKETYDEEVGHYTAKRRHNDEERLTDSEDDCEAPPAKNPHLEVEEGSPEKKMTAAERMMASMGYKEGTGLGKSKQGMVEPVALSTQRGRIGLGHGATKAVGRNFAETWDETVEEKTIEEKVEWIASSQEAREWSIRQIENCSWMELGPKKMTIEDETEFCDGEILRQMIEAKDVFDVMSDRDLREARTRANPYETIGGAFFQNRAAMKTANLDKVFDWLFSGEDESTLMQKNPLNGERPSSNCDRDLPVFYFADVCAGPGGFSEYILWRKAYYNAKGFGFTLKGKDDFKLGKFAASSSYYFEPFYGVHNDGDVMKPDNIDSLEGFIHKGTSGVGVDLMMADGGFSVEGQENIQEILSKRLYLCQLLVSLCIVKEGGNFFCKLFDIFCPFSAGLVYLMYMCYDKISLHKPHTSRPANSERYIICKGLRKKFSEPVRDYLKRINIKLDELKKVDSADDVNIIVPPDVMRDDDDFLAYLTRHNERLALRQTTYLKKYLSFARNQSLIDKDQGSLREECLNYWRIPNRTRSDRRERDRLQIDPDQYFGRFTRKIYGREDFNVRLPSFSLDLISNPSDKQLKYAEFTFNLLTKRVASQPQLLISTGEAVFMWNKQWERCDNKIMRIPDRTVLLVEKVTTYKRDDTRLQRLATDGLIRILDAAVLNGDDVSNLTYINRMKAAAKFCKALKLVVPTIREGWGKNERLLTPPPLVVAEYYSLNQLREVRRQFTRCRFEGEDVFLFEEHGHLIICKGVRIFRILKDSWKMGWSCSQSRLYAFPVQQRPTLGSLYESDWEKHECCASFWESAMTKKDVTGKQQMQCLWKWENSFEDNYGPRVILEEDSHRSGPTVNSIMHEIQKTDDMCRRSSK